MNDIGKEVSKTSRQGGGVYVVIGHINCSRCKTLIEEREVIEPNKGQKKRGSYYYHYSWCPNCGLYENDPKTKVNL